MDNSRRGFLAKIGALATAPVLTAFVDDKNTGLAVPDREIQVATEAPAPLLISSSTGTMPINSWSTMSNMYDGRSHTDMHRGDGTLIFVVNGEPWMVPAFKVPPTYRTVTP